MVDPVQQVNDGCGGREAEPPRGPAVCDLVSDLKQRFRDLAAEWKQATRFSSVPSDVDGHPAYRAIIEMGRAALPFIFDELRSEPHFWFTALRSITRENPVSAEDRGKVHKMADAWLLWASKNGY